MIKKAAHQLIIIGFLLLLFSSPALLYAVGSGAIITTVVGNGTSGFSGDGGLATEAQLNFSSGVVLNGLGHLYIVDRSNHRIRKVIPTTNIITTVAGSGPVGPGTGGFSGDNGLATEAQLNFPARIALDEQGNLYIADSYNNRVRKVIVDTGVITTVAGNGMEAYGGDNGPATKAQLQAPTGVAIDEIGNLYIADANNNRIRKVIAATGIITTVAGSGPIGHANGGFSGDNGPATSAQLNYPTHVAVDKLGNLYIADSYNHRIRKIIAATGIITTIAGSGSTGPASGGFSGDGELATNAQLNFPTSMAVDELNNIYIADNGNHRIRKVIAATGIITTVAGSGEANYGGDQGPAIEAQLNFPAEVAIDNAGNLYIADQFNHRIRLINQALQVSIVGPATGVINTRYTFTATLLPPTVTLPLSYTWSPSPSEGQSTAIATYIWITARTQTITVTVQSGSVTTTATHIITLFPEVSEFIYLPAIIKLQ